MGRSYATPGEGLSNASSRSVILAGYTFLVVDSSLLLTGLDLIRSVVQSSRWSIIVPLAAISELDDLVQSGEPSSKQMAQTATEYLDTIMKAGTKSIKILTSKGNYLTNLMIRSEDIDYQHAPGKTKAAKYESKMEELLLTATKWQADHFIDRSALLGVELDHQARSLAAKSCLLTLNADLRQRASYERITIANNAEIAEIWRDISPILEESSNRDKG